jgi:RNA polymerase sigma-70 factor (ECF subfamily)
MTELSNRPPAAGALQLLGDQILVDRAVDGDTVAFETLIRRHGPLMRAYAIRLLGSAIEADDALQNAFYIAWQRLPELRDGSAVRSWLMRIVSRQAFSQLRSKPKTESAVVLEALPNTEDVQPENVAIRGAQLAALSAALARIPEDQRQCWLLREVVGLSYDEIAQELAMTPGMVRGKLARARASIAIDMEEWR